MKGKKTTEYIQRRNKDKREKFIKTQGLEMFEKVAAVDKSYAVLQDLPCPPSCVWIWEHFMNIWNECERDFNGNVVLTYRDIYYYCECMNVPLNVAERAMIIKMKHWAMDEIFKLNDESKSGND